MGAENIALTVVAPEMRSAELDRFMPVMSMTTAMQRREIVVRAFADLMKEGEDYGKIPGSQKPSLLQPGAQKLDNLFGLVPRFEIVERIEDWTGKDHANEPLFRYMVRCLVYRGEFVMGEGVGECNSWESKYRWRTSERTCPSCGKPFIVKTRKKTWWCAKFKGGCNAGFPEDHPRIINQEVGRIANPDIFEQVNTILKMAQKRAHIAATINATSASEFVTQDLEDLRRGDGEDGQREVMLDSASADAGSGVAMDAPASPTGHAIPEEIALIVKRISEPGGIDAAESLVNREMKEAFPANYGMEIVRLQKKHNMSNPTFDNWRAYVLEAYKLAQWAKAEEAKRKQAHETASLKRASELVPTVEELKAGKLFDDPASAYPE